MILRKYEEVHEQLLNLIIDIEVEYKNAESDYINDEREFLSIERALAVTTYIDARLREINPNLITSNVLMELEIAIKKISEFVVGFLKETQSWTNFKFNENIDKLIQISSLIPIGINSYQLNNFKNKMDMFEDTIVSQEKRITKAIDLSNDEYEELFESLRKNNTNLIEEVHNLSNNFKKELIEIDYEKKEFRKEIENYVTKFRKQFSELHDNFLKTQEDRSQSFINEIENVKTRFEQTHAKQSNEFDELLQDQNNNFNIFNLQTKKGIQETLKEIEKHKEKVEKMVGAIAGGLIADHYKNVANKHELYATRWQWLTISCFIITIAASIYGFFIADIPNDNWQQFSGRFIIAGALGSLTAYSARRAKFHTDTEKKNRKLEVELLTLDPFIANFSKEEQSELKQKLFPLIFGKEEK